MKKSLKALKFRKEIIAKFTNKIMGGSGDDYNDTGDSLKGGSIENQICKSTNGTVPNEDGCKG